MTPRTLTVAALALAASFFLAGPAHADDQDGKKAEGRKGGHALKKLDTDGDGRISREEAAAAPKLAEHFAQIDANGDGYITKDEAKAARAQHQGKGDKKHEKKREKHEKKAAKGGGKRHKKHGRGHGKGKHHKKHRGQGRGNRG